MDVPGCQCWKNTTHAHQIKCGISLSPKFRIALNPLPRFGVRIAGSRTFDTGAFSVVVLLPLAPSIAASFTCPFSSCIWGSLVVEVGWGTSPSFKLSIITDTIVCTLMATMDVTTIITYSAPPPDGFPAILTINHDPISGERRERNYTHQI